MHSRAYLQDGAVFTVVQKGDSLSAIVRDCFEPFSSKELWMRKVREVAELNRAIIRDPNHIRPGQVLALSAPFSMGKKPFHSNELNEMYWSLGQMSPTEQERFFEHFDVLEALEYLSENPAVFLSVLGTAQGRELLSQILDFQKRNLKPPQPLIQEFERLIVKVITHRVEHFRGGSQVILQKSRISLRRQKVFIVKSDPSSIRAFSDRLKLLRRWKGVIDRIPQVGLAIQAGEGSLRVSMAPRGERMREFSKVLGGFGGGMLGVAPGVMASSFCSILTVGSLGSAGVFCAPLAVVFHFVFVPSFSKLGEKVGGKVYEELD